MKFYGVLAAGGLQHPCPWQAEAMPNEANCPLPSALETLPGSLGRDAGPGCLVGCVDGRVSVLQLLTQQQYELLAEVEDAMGRHPVTASLSGWHPKDVCRGR